MRWTAQRGFSLAAMAVGLLVIPVDLDTLRADNPAGHVLANRFAAQAEKSTAATSRPKSSTDKARREAERRRADEQEMLARARSEAEERHAELERERDRLEQEQRQSEALAENERRAEETAQRHRRDAEIAARAADERRRQESAAIAAQTKRHEAQAAEHRRREEQAREEQAREELVRLEQEQQQRRQAELIAERDAEGRRIEEKLRRAEAARNDRDARREAARREPVTTGAPLDPASAEPREQAHHPAPPPFMAESAVETRSPTRVTVLLLMEPGNRGIRRKHKTADPVLCSTNGCWISGGSNQPAYLMAHRKALGFGRTWGERAGACSNSLGCVFRNVELGALPGWLQPVDMRLVRHDRRQPQRIDAAARCRVQDEALQCRSGHYGGDYVMWVIPEHVAAQGGPELLEKALTDGLPDLRHASLAPMNSR